MVVYSTPDGVIATFLRYKPSGRTVALGSIELPNEMSTRYISLGQMVMHNGVISYFICLFLS